MKCRTAMKGSFGLVLGLFVSLANARAQMPMLCPMPAGKGPAPLLYVRFVAPAGVHATLYQGNPNGVEVDSTQPIGLRPGYCYRVKLTLTDLPGLPAGVPVHLYPTLEVRGALQLPPKLSARDHPVPILFSADEIDRILRSSELVSKFISIENPEKAYPAASRPDYPLELPLLAGHDPYQEAHRIGRLLVVVRMGEREVSAEELVAENVPGTILLPGARGMGLPARPPTIAYHCFRLHDPTLGPPPCDAECLHDGGDEGWPAGVDAKGTIRGVDPSDTVAAYVDNLGRRRLTISNRVCLCVPRYVVLRKETRLDGVAGVQLLRDRSGLQGQVVVQRLHPSLLVLQHEQLAGYRGPLRPSGLEQFQGAVVSGRVEGTRDIIRVKATLDVTGVCKEVKEPPAKPLLLHKWLDKPAAQIGDVVTFYLRYTNPGGQPIRDVVVADSLTTRLEFVPGSANADREAVFTTQMNEAGSSILRWEIRGTLQPGQSGLLSFQARIR